MVELEVADDGETITTFRNFFSNQAVPLLIMGCGLPDPFPIGSKITNKACFVLFITVLENFTYWPILQSVDKELRIPIKL